MRNPRLRNSQCCSVFLPILLIMMTAAKCDRHDLILLAHFIFGVATETHCVLGANSYVWQQKIGVQAFVVDDQ